MTNYAKVKMTNYNLWDDTLEFDVQTEFEGAVEKIVITGSDVSTYCDRHASGEALNNVEFCIFSMFEDVDADEDGDPTSFIGKTFELDC